jgi:lipoprotein signal peptidase
MGNGVRDFLDLRNPFNGENLWPVFNVADITILIGVLVFLGWSMLMAPEDKASEPAPEAGNQNDPEKETA